MIDNIKVGKRIKERREELGLTIQQVAEKVKVHKSTVQRYESGNIKDIKMPVVESIANALNVDPMWLIGKIESNSKSKEYEHSTYLANLYFNSVMKWSEDRLLNENETVIIREHFSDLLLRYKQLVESYAYTAMSWENSKENYNAIYKDRLSNKEIKELFLKQELRQEIKSLTDWIEAVPNWISRNEKDIPEVEEEYLKPLAAHDKNDNFSDEDTIRDLDIMKDDELWE